MPYSLKGRNVLVTGGSRGLGALLCQRFAAAGSNVAVNYLSSEGAAKEVAAKVEEHGVNAIVIQADAGIAVDNARMIKSTVDAFGGLDIIVANAGWTKFEKFGDLGAMSNEEWDKLVRDAAPIFNKNADGGAYLITSSIAGISTGGSSMGYSVTKAAGLQLMKCLAVTQGPKIRINSILPGLLLTEWGLKYSNEAIEGLKDKAALKKETLLEDCVEAFIATAQNTSMTGQQIVVDSGLCIR